MILRTRQTKGNGLTGTGYWYVASVYLKENGEPCFTISTDIKRAKQFNEDTAKRFHDKFISMGILSKPFDIVK